MCDDALCRLYKRGLPYDWQNKYDASGQVYSTVAALVPFFERIEQGEQRLHRGGQDKRNSGHDNSRSYGSRSSNSSHRGRGGNNSSRGRHSQQRGGHSGRGNTSNNNSHGTSDKYCTVRAV